MLADLALITPESDAWVFHDGVYTTKVGDLTISVKRGILGVNAEWSVSHDSFGKQLSNQPADSISAGKRAAVAWCQRWCSQDHHED